MIVTRSRTVAAAPEAVWEVVAEPRRLARWWPRTERVKGITAKGWTTVLRSERGRAVRADWRLEQSGTPFENVLSERRVEARLEAVDGGTQVTLELRQQPRGRSKLGSLQMRRAAGRELDGALDGLEDVLA